MLCLQWPCTQLRDSQFAEKNQHFQIPNNFGYKTPIKINQSCCGLLSKYSKFIHPYWMLSLNNVARTWPNKYNISQHLKMLAEKLEHFKLEPKTRNMSQNIASEWPNMFMSCQTMLRSFCRPFNMVTPTRLALCFFNLRNSKYSVSRGS